MRSISCTDLAQSRASRRLVRYQKYQFYVCSHPCEVAVCPKRPINSGITLVFGYYKLMLSTSMRTIILCTCYNDIGGK